MAVTLDTSDPISTLILGCLASMGFGLEAPLIGPVDRSLGNPRPEWMRVARWDWIISLGLDYNSHGMLAMVSSRPFGMRLANTLFITGLMCRL